MRTCLICKKIIDTERAEAIPDTRLCIEHAKEIIKYGGEFTLTGTTETTSKQGSLKKNYGGVNVNKTRNNQAIERLQADYDASREN
jgi:hypothetical protein